MCHALATLMTRGHHFIISDILRRVRRSKAQSAFPLSEQCTHSSRPWRIVILTEYVGHEQGVVHDRIVAT